MGGAVKASREKLEPGSDFRPFPLEEYEARWQRVHDAMTRQGYETAVVWGKTSTRSPVGSAPSSAASSSTSGGATTAHS